jgi:hypothetical protein
VKRKNEQFAQKEGKVETIEEMANLGIDYDEFFRNEYEEGNYREKGLTLDEFKAEFYLRSANPVIRGFGRKIKERD